MSQKLSLRSAIFMNLNIMAGAGLFINSVLLTKLSGIIGCLTYAAVGIFMLPLVASTADLVRLHPSGGYYAYSKPISTSLAFFSGWLYFFTKLASTALVLFVSSSLLCQIFPTTLGLINPITLSLVTLSIFTYLNLFNMRVGSVIQSIFFVSKTIPILIVALIGILIFKTSLISSHPINLSSISYSIPFALYSLCGFEVACSITRKMENPERNGPKAIFYSFFIIIAVYTIFQLFASIFILPNLSSVETYRNLFSAVINSLHLNPEVAAKSISFANLSIAISALGGAYGLLFANTWNLYTIAEQKHIPMSAYLTKLNKHQIPTLIVISEALICTFYLFLTNGRQIPLQQVAALGPVIVYSISMVALIMQSKFIKKIYFLAVGTCIGLLTSCIISIATKPLLPLIALSSIIVLGATLFWISKQR